MANKNELLKDIAVALGATVTDKDNDTNELLALIRDNIGNAGGSAGGSAKLYRHDIELYWNSDYSDSTLIHSNNDDTWETSAYLTVYTSSDEEINTAKKLIHIIRRCVIPCSVMYTYPDPDDGSPTYGRTGGTLTLASDPDVLDEKDYRYEVRYSMTKSNATIGIIESWKGIASISDNVIEA